MPYIKQEERAPIDFAMEPLLTRVADMSEGQMNYVITQLIRRWTGPEANYARYNSVVGFLESAKLEFYRRGVAPYEETKILGNGDLI